jgi:glutamate racemase
MVLKKYWVLSTTEVVGNFSSSKHIGILGTAGTVQSNSYVIEIEKFFPDIKVFQQSCPMWVPLIENNEHNSNGADFFVKEYIDALLKQSGKIDTLLLACTHYPLLIDKIKKYVPAETKIISQGNIVAESLKDYLQRHPEIEKTCLKEAKMEFYTTDSAEDFNNHASIFFGEKLISKHVDLNAE